MTLLSALSGQFQLFDKNKSGSINKDVRIIENNKNNHIY